MATTKPVDQSTKGKHTMMEGFEDASADLVAYWDLKDPLHVMPLYVTLSDSKIEPLKTSVLIHCKAMAEAMLPKIRTDEDDGSEEGELIEVKEGDLVGVWYKPGMKAIGTCKEIPVYIFQDGEKATGKINPMKVFRVGIKPGSPRAPLPVLADYRKTSKRNAIPGLGVAAPTEAQRQRQGQEVGPEENIW